MKLGENKTLKTTPREEAIIARLANTSVFGRLDRGEVGIVEDVDWEKAPQVPPPLVLPLPKRVFRALEAASRKRHTTPRRLAVRLLREGLLEKKTG
jgi:hypothetical protein